MIATDLAAVLVVWSLCTAAGIADGEGIPIEEFNSCGRTCL